jgi:heterodisulfide reductase subunit A
LRGTKNKEPKLGVVLCTCDKTIGKNIDFPELEKRISNRPNVVFVDTHDKLCTREGQEFLKKEISSSGVERVVIAACTPRTYEDLLKKGAASAGLNEYLIENVNIREQCDWIHQDKEASTDKAEILILSALGRVIFAQSIEDKNVSLTNKTDALVIGGGVAGITASQELTRRGIHVHLVEKSDKLGGRAFVLDPIRLAEDEGLTLPVVDELMNNDKVDVLLQSEVVKISGLIGDYHVQIKTNDEIKEVVVGAVIIATGSDLFDANKLLEYRYDDSDVIDFLQLEEMMAKKALKVPSTSKVPKRVNFIQCVGSRDDNKGNSHCSLVCCTYAIKQAGRIKALYPDTQVYIHYMDLRGPDNGFEEEYLAAQKRGVSFIRGRVAEIQRDKDGLTLRTEHIELGDVMPFQSDLVVLAVGQEASNGTKELAEMVHLPLDVDGFMGYYNDRYDILDRRGVSLAGSAQGPRGINKSQSDAKKAANEIADVLKNGFKVRTVHSIIDEDRCMGCKLCEEFCPYEAISMKTVKNHITDEGKVISSVDLATCQGCGACAMVCPGGVPQLAGYSNKEVLAQIDEVC